ncbi:S-adenosyl-L-methionine-dependent methyltransferase [Lasiosphaeria hispida]|uniref:S-adenosyl-L-methionine-dependent methyltransferase n=1 Tax=Lasiosphaeria hispida TaxID=260671 RepID=A0AAJ0MFI7_9PEZI|nr:S-adenosyl-L-methionine-dependent methyltransferase [Lasiosphaeria hispida]
MSEAAKYIHGHAPEVLAAHAWRTAARDAAHVLPHIQPSFTVLDVGCGPGTISADLAALVPTGRLTCLEISESALAAARQTCADRGLSNVGFVAGDVTTRLPFPDGVFDIVHAHQVIVHLAQPVAALREMRRVLRPGGLVACKDMVVKTAVWYPPDPRLALWEVGIAGTIAENGADPQMGIRLKAVALEAGFGEDEIDCRGSCWAFTDREAVDYWGNSWVARLGIGTELRERILRGGHATEQAVDDFVGAVKAWTGEPGAWFGCMHGELLARKT